MSDPAEEAEDIVSGTAFARVFTNTALGRLIYEPHEDWEVLVSGAVNFDGPENAYIKPEVRWKYGAHLKVVAGADIMVGEEDTFFGQFEEDSRLFGSIKLSF